jgi:hypothetical protein
MIKLKTYSIINNLTLTNELLVTYINNFWIDIFNDIKENSHLMLMCKVQFSAEEKGYRTLGHLRKVNFNDKDLFIEYLSQRLSILNDSYIALPISKITFSFIIKEGLCTDSERALLQDFNNKSTFSHNFNNMNLPISMNPSDYGNILLDNYVQVDGENYHRFIVNGSSKTYQIDVSSNSIINKVTILGKIDLSWIDTKINGIESDVFKREINKSTIYFMDGQIVLRKQVLPAKPFKKTSIDNKLINSFYTMDIETIKNNGKLIPYLICAYNGNDYITSYGKDQKSLFNKFFDQLLSNIKNRTTTYIYAHNLSGFDGIFLLKYLLAYGKVEPLLFKGKLISIKLKLKIKGHKTKTIIFKDSYLMLPHSLRQLCEAFKVSNPKGYFPFLLNDIFYTGVLPKFELFTSLSSNKYLNLINEYSNKIWNFKDEAIKYCELDCVSLHEVISKFSNLIFKEFKVDPIKVLTLPALAMKIYKTSFMPDNKIFQLHGIIEQNIRQSYSGGAVDVYIPHNRITAFFSNIKAKFIKLYYYDVNGLYPYVMANFDMPIGKPIAFEGDIRYQEAASGFFYCKITSPDNLNHPILQRRVKTSDGIRTIAGLGTWHDWIYSDEMWNAMDYGYTFEVIKGYQFERGNIFKDYVNKMYNLRLQYPKGDALNLIAKLLLNSLYGKFGMKDETTKMVILENMNDLDKEIISVKLDLYGPSIKDIVTFENYTIFVINTTVDLFYNQSEDFYHGTEVNVAIASAITAEARIFMSYFKNNPDFKLYYSDTDSAFIFGDLPSDLIGKGLGQVKLEYTINKAVFLAPKVYAIITDEGKEIIKVKGLTHEVISKLNFSDLEALLIKDSTREFTQEKWFKSVINGEITTSDVIYTLKNTSNKREQINLNFAKLQASKALGG